MFKIGLALTVGLSLHVLEIFEYLKIVLMFSILFIKQYALNNR